jgi:hypothetical protein
VQVPDEQMRPPVQTLPQELQLAGSVCVLTHEEPHAVWPEGHDSTQVPL